MYVNLQFYAYSYAAFDLGIRQKEEWRVAPRTTRQSDQIRNSESGSNRLI